MLKVGNVMKLSMTSEGQLGTTKIVWHLRSITKRAMSCRVAIEGPVRLMKKYKMEKINPSNAFVKTGKDELEGLLKEGTFKAVSMSKVPEGMRVFISRFIDEITGAGEIMRNKSRLVSQNYGDEDATRISTKAPTVQRFYQMGFLCHGASLPGSVVFSGDHYEIIYTGHEALGKARIYKGAARNGSSGRYGSLCRQDSI